MVNISITKKRPIMTTQVTVAKTTQTAVPELNMAEKTIYYLVIGNGDAKIQLNVGEKTYKAVKALEERYKMQITEPLVELANKQLAKQENSKK